MDGKKRIALLGDTGFVGRNVQRVLREAGYDPIGVSSRNGCDLREADQAKKALRVIKPEVIVNCAAHVGSLNYVTEQAATVITDNSRMILSVYEAVAAECPDALLVNPIANCAYPAKADTFIEDYWWDGHLHRSVLSYGATRRLLWAVAESYQMQNNVRSINLLVPNMYGPYDSTDPNKAHALNALVSKFVKAKKQNDQEVTIWGTGIAIREWLLAKDFGRIVLEVVRNPQMMGLAEPINVGQNFGLSVKELVEIITRTFDYRGKIRWDGSMPDGAPKKVMDERRFKKVFRNFEFTGFDEGIRSAIEYYESIYPY